MKKNIITLAFMLVFASMPVMADDGETTHGGKIIEPPPTSASAQPNTDVSIFDQLLNVVYAVIA